MDDTSKKKTIATGTPYDSDDVEFARRLYAAHTSMLCGDHPSRSYEEAQELDDETMTQLNNQYWLELALLVATTLDFTIVAVEETPDPEEMH